MGSCCSICKSLCPAVGSLPTSALPVAHLPSCPTVLQGGLWKMPQITKQSKRGCRARVLSHPVKLTNISSWASHREQFIHSVLIYLTLCYPCHEGLTMDNNFFLCFTLLWPFVENHYICVSYELCWLQTSVAASLHLLLEAWNVMARSHVNKHGDRDWSLQLKSVRWGQFPDSEKPRNLLLWALQRQVL